MIDITRSPFANAMEYLKDNKITPQTVSLEYLAELMIIMFEEDIATEINNGNDEGAYDSFTEVSKNDNGYLETYCDRYCTEYWDFFEDYWNMTSPLEYDYK